ncbi:MAG: DUF3667 domain-containing protein [Winogradskyella sp.]|nr:DUF3667 domain-containing protein [Winogradskyella sp.]MBT8376410.1 DUF3667 domain-containing protein [Bacteroidia bacterium]NNC44377.1 DUF3667 domain-containing protein [Winogradskyella sp.]NNF86495.1 DUF3667 domain-containing protein [Winogradskyella sp.]NNL83301.1 DUF3667 domain-containing protein [Winogradskyella sp.]
METNPITCPNCDNEYKGEFAFCPHCGQKSNDELTIGVLFYNTISNYFSFDARFFKSFIPLVFKPGYLASKFLQGKRLMYLHPAQMYLFISVIFFFILSFDVRETTQKVDAQMKDEFTSKAADTVESKQGLDSLQIEKLMKPLKENKSKLGLKDEDLQLADSLIKAESTKPMNVNRSFSFNGNNVDSLITSGASDAMIYKEMGMSEDAGYFERKMYSQALKFYKEKGIGSIIQTFFDTIPIALFFLLPLFALILKIFYFNKGNYSHHLVFSFYFFSFLFTILSIVFGINRIWDIPDWIDWIIVFSTFIYFFLALKNFYRQHWFLSLFKSGIITFISLLMVLPFAVVLISIFAFMYY